jgi:hypothetical protein
MQNPNSALVKIEKYNFEILNNLIIIKTLKHFIPALNPAPVLRSVFRLQGVRNEMAVLHGQATAGV